ncbi:MAG: D-aminoacyl-tRNA deacylase, partial [Planctomycetota bacterium]
MIAVVQRVTRGEVRVAGKTVGSVGRGAVVLVGARRGDDSAAVEILARKVAELRIFEDENGKMNLSLCDLGLGVLVVSQFTLLADLKKGRRPGFDRAERPERASRLLEQFVRLLEGHGLTVEQGRFGEEMQLSLVNQGPATFILDTDLWLRRPEDA